MPYTLRRCWRFAVGLAYQFHPNPARRVDPASYRWLWRWAGWWEREKP